MWWNPQENFAFPVITPFFLIPFKTKRIYAKNNSAKVLPFSDDFMKKARLLIALRWRLDVKPIALITKFYFSHFLSTGIERGLTRKQARWQFPVVYLHLNSAHRLWLEVKNSIISGTSWLSRVEGKTHPHYHSILVFPLSSLKLKLNNLFSLPLEQLVPLQ